MAAKLAEAMESDYSSSEDSSEEMVEYGALARSKGLLKPKTFINNVEALQARIVSLAESSSSDGQSMTCTVERDQEEAVDVHDDFKREAFFVQQAKSAIGVVFPRLAAAGIPVDRPPDYFAEMVKSDAHMKKIQAKLLSEEQSMEHSEKARKQRELKKFGKKVQHEVLEKRRKEKRDALATIKNQRTKSPMTRQARDEKFGFGGKKGRDTGKKGRDTGKKTRRPPAKGKGGTGRRK